MGFDISFSHVCILLRYFPLRKPVPSSFHPKWQLSKVLDLLLSVNFMGNIALQLLILKTLFLIALGSGERVRDIHAMSRHEDLLRFEDHPL